MKKAINHIQANLVDLILIWDLFKYLIFQPVLTVL